MIIRDDHIRSTGIEVWSLKHLQYQVEKYERIKYSKRREDESKNSEKSSKYKPDHSHNKWYNGEGNTRTFYDTEIVSLDAHAELIGSYPIIEIESSLIDLFFDFSECGFFDVCFLEGGFWEGFDAHNISKIRGKCPKTEGLSRE